MTTVKALSRWATDVRERNGTWFVTLRRDIDIDAVRALLDQPDLTSVTGLRIPGTVGVAGLRAILAAPGLPHLVALSLSGFTDTEGVVDAVFDSPMIERLQVLKMWGVSDAMDGRLARGKAKSLRQLDIRNSRELTFLNRCFESPHVASLRFLTIERTSIADATLLFDNEAASTLRALSLADGEFDSETVDTLLSSPHMRSLRKLDLSQNTQDDVVASLEELLRARKLGALESLALRECELEDIDWNRVHFPKLRVLDVRNNPLSFQECNEILRAPGLRSLEKLVVTLSLDALPVRIDPRLVIDPRKKKRKSPQFGH